MATRAIEYFVRGIKQTDADVGYFKYLADYRSNKRMGTYAYQVIEGTQYTGIPSQQWQLLPWQRHYNNTFALCKTGDYGYSGWTRRVTTFVSNFSSGISDEGKSVVIGYFPQSPINWQVQGQVFPITKVLKLCVNGATIADGIGRAALASYDVRMYGGHPIASVCSIGDGNFASADVASTYKSLSGWLSATDAYGLPLISNILGSVADIISTIIGAFNTNTLYSDVKNINFNIGDEIKIVETRTLVI